MAAFATANVSGAAPSVGPGPDAQPTIAELERRIARLSELLITCCEACRARGVPAGVDREEVRRLAGAAPHGS